MSGQKYYRKIYLRLHPRKSDPGDISDFIKTLYTLSGHQNMPIYRVSALDLYAFYGCLCNVSIGFQEEFFNEFFFTLFVLILSYNKILGGI